MAKFNELLVGRYNRYVQKLLSMKGPATLESLNPELQVTLQTFHGVENRYLEGWDTFQVGVQIAAGGAGNFGALRLRNPFGSNLIAVIEAARCSNGVASQHEISEAVTSLDLATVIPTVGAGLDQRGRPGPTCVLSQSNGATVDLSNVLDYTVLPAGGAFDFIDTIDQEIPLSGSVAIQLRCALANTTTNLSFRWRERLLEESERA